MTIFVDASAMVAIIAGEPEAPDLKLRLWSDPDRRTSALAYWEATMAVSRLAKATVDEGRSYVDDLLERAQIAAVSIGFEEARLALDAHARFGKGRHPARLNMGDCFAYACARANGAKLLYKGDDFALTDIEAA